MKAPDGRPLRYCGNPVPHAPHIDHMIVCWGRFDHLLGAMSHDRNTGREGTAV